MAIGGHASRNSSRAIRFFQNEPFRSGWVSLIKATVSILGNGRRLAGAVGTFTMSATDAETHLIPDPAAPVAMAGAAAALPSEKVHLDDEKTQ